MPLPGRSARWDIVARVSRTPIPRPLLPLCLLLPLLAAAENDAIFRPVEETPGLPRVLLIGDSISIGYTPFVREMLQGKANVQRVPENATHTRHGLARLDAWLGEKPWDVIHVNFGLHDLKVMEGGAQQVPPEEYERNLEAIVKRLQASGAKVLFATTTPVPEGNLSPLRHPADAPRYNGIARQVMVRHGVAINDLYAAILPGLHGLQRPANVHFTEDGSRFLARQVTAAILRALPVPR